jgi:hypothetical protein
VHSIHVRPTGEIPILSEQNREYHVLHVDAKTLRVISEQKLVIPALK